MQISSRSRTCGAVVRCASRPTRAALALFAFAFVTPKCAQAEPATGDAADATATSDASRSPAENENSARSVGQHSFIYPALIDSAFVATYVGLRIHVASFDMQNLPTDFGNLHISAIHIAEGLDVGFRITDFLGVWATLGARTFISTNAKSLVYEGATFDYGWNAGAILRLLRSESSGTQVSLRGSFGHTSGQLSSLAGLFPTTDTNVAIADAVDSQLLRTPIRETNFGGSIAVAQSLSPMFGLQISGGFGWASMTIEPYDITAGKRVESQRRGVIYSAGIAASCDFMAVRFPLAIMLEYRLSRQTSSPGALRTDDLSNVSGLFGGVYYSGRPNLQLGVGGGLDLGLAPGVTRFGRSDSPSLVLGQFILRYIW